MNYKQLQEALANVKPASFDAPADKPSQRECLTKAAPATRDAAFIASIAKGFAPVIQEAIEAAVGPLKARIEELERRPELKYLGVFRDDGRKYSEGSAVTHSGGIWIALRATTEKPNHSADWQLAVKSGDHSTPTPRSDAATANARTNGHYSRPRSPCLRSKTNC